MANSPPQNAQPLNEGSPRGSVYFFGDEPPPSAQPRDEIPQIQPPQPGVDPVLYDVASDDIDAVQRWINARRDDNGNVYNLGNILIGALELPGVSERMIRTLASNLRVRSRLIAVLRANTSLERMELIFMDSIRADSQAVVSVLTSFGDQFEWSYIPSPTVITALIDAGMPATLRWDHPADAVYDLQMYPEALRALLSRLEYVPPVGDRSIIDEITRTLNIDLIREALEDPRYRRDFGLHAYGLLLNTTMTDDEVLEIAELTGNNTIIGEDEVRFADLVQTAAVTMRPKVLRGLFFMLQDPDEIGLDEIYRVVAIDYRGRWKELMEHLGRGSWAEVGEVLAILLEELG